MFKKKSKTYVLDQCLGSHSKVKAKKIINDVHIFCFQKHSRFKLKVAFSKYCIKSHHPGIYIIVDFKGGGGCDYFYRIMISIQFCIKILCCDIGSLKATPPATSSTTPASSTTPTTSALTTKLLSSSTKQRIPNKAFSTKAMSITSH